MPDVISLDRRIEVRATAEDRELIDRAVAASGTLTAGSAGADGSALPVSGVSAGYLAPRLLNSADRLDSFQCRSEEQTIWLHRHARQAHARGGTSRVFVVTEVGGSDVVAYDAWCMASLTPEQAPPSWRM